MTCVVPGDRGAADRQTLVGGVEREAELAGGALNDAVVLKAAPSQRDVGFTVREIGVSLGRREIAWVNGRMRLSIG